MKYKYNMAGVGSYVTYSFYLVLISMTSLSVPEKTQSTMLQKNITPEDTILCQCKFSEEPCNYVPLLSTTTDH